jgi:hypothetical protein
MKVKENTRQEQIDGSTSTEDLLFFLASWYLIATGVFYFSLVRRERLSTPAIIILRMQFLLNFLPLFTIVRAHYASRD